MNIVPCPKCQTLAFTARLRGPGSARYMIMDAEPSSDGEWVLVSRPPSRPPQVIPRIEGQLTLFPSTAETFYRRHKHREGEPCST